MTRERAELCSLLDRLGPSQPTLCAGWTTYDLAAHLVLRERRPIAPLGIIMRPLNGYAVRTQQALKEAHSFPALVDLVRQGPPLFSPFRFVPGLDGMVNTLEFFTHHEDVRRAQPEWAPRQLAGDEVETLWRATRRSARWIMRHAPVGIVMRTPDGMPTTIVRGAPAVTVSGPVPELALYALGRNTVAHVSVDGPSDAIQRLARTVWGLYRPPG